MASAVESTRNTALHLFRRHCMVLTSRSLAAATDVTRQRGAQCLMRLFQEGLCTRTWRRRAYHYRMVQCE